MKSKRVYGQNSFEEKTGRVIEFAQATATRILQFPVGLIRQRAFRSPAGNTNAHRGTRGVAVGAGGLRLGGSSRKNDGRRLAVQKMDGQYFGESTNSASLFQSTLGYTKC